MLLKPLILARRSSLAPASELKIAVGEEGDGAAALGEDRWAKMLPELLAEILRRVEASEDLWPARRSVVAFAGVCRRWRNVATVVVRPPLETGKITFPSALKQPGPMDAPIQCFIMRNKRNSTFYLYLSLTKTLSDEGKFLLAARRFRNGGHTEYIISLDAHDISQGSNAYVGKLRSNFLSTSFTIYDSEPPSEGGKTSSRGASPRFTSKQISPQVPSGNFKIGRVSYKSNLFRSKGPRRLVCTVNCPQAQDPLEEELQKPKPDKNVVLKNKAPRWHGHLRCWCLNFHGRVTLASVKNFQLVSKSVDAGDETVLLQFGKVGDDVFTMDYQQPLSAFQAFAICLTSFGTKIFCE